jgi:hypothetical protein
MMESMTRRALWLMLFLIPFRHELTIPDARQFAKAIGVPNGWRIQKLENIYSRRTGRLSLGWVSLYEVKGPANWVFATLPTWEEAERFAIRKIPPQV